MFSYLQDLILAGLLVYIDYPFWRTAPSEFWVIVAFEWLTLQTLLIYTYIKLVKSQNYFKQILALLWILCILSIYFAFMQLELFACFMFVAEFTIVIFFYTLFLHLRVSVSVTESSNKSIETTKILILVIFAIVIGYGASNLITTNTSIVFTDLYIKISYIALNDLAFFASTIMRTNFIVHFIVGLILLFLTIFLFFTTNVYYFMNITRRDSAKLAASKLSTQRGYYEQTAEEVQKIISKSREDL